MDKEFIAEKLKTIMIERELTPMEFSEIAGISRSTIEGYIKAKSLLKLDNLILICEKLQISSDVFLGLKEKTPSPSLKDDEREILDVYRQLDRRGQARMLTAGYEELDRMKGGQAATTAISQNAG